MLLIILYDFTFHGGFLIVKKYIVRLSEEERVLLRDIVKKLKGTSQKVRRANILLKADINGPNWSDVKIAEALSCRTQTVENVRRRLVTEGDSSTSTKISLQRSDFRIQRGNKGRRQYSGCRIKSGMTKPAGAIHFCPRRLIRLRFVRWSAGMI